MTEKELLREVETELRTFGMSTEKKIALWRAKKDLQTALTSNGDSRPSGAMIIRNLETKSLHELQMLQKELNYQKRQVSKAIRTQIRLSKPDQSK